MLIVGCLSNTFWKPAIDIYSDVELVACTTSTYLKFKVICSWQTLIFGIWQLMAASVADFPSKKDRRRDEVFKLMKIVLHHDCCIPAKGYNPPTICPNHWTPPELIFVGYPLAQRISWGKFQLESVRSVHQQQHIPPSKAMTIHRWPQPVIASNAGETATSGLRRNGRPPSFSVTYKGLSCTLQLRSSTLLWYHTLVILHKFEFVRSSLLKEHYQADPSILGSESS